MGSGGRSQGARNPRFPYIEVHRVWFSGQAKDGFHHHNPHLQEFSLGWVVTVRMCLGLFIIPSLEPRRSKCPWPSEQTNQWTFLSSSAYHSWFSINCSFIVPLLLTKHPQSTLYFHPLVVPPHCPLPTAPPAQTLNTECPQLIISKSSFHTWIQNCWLCSS